MKKKNITFEFLMKMKKIKWKQRLATDKASYNGKLAGKLKRHFNNI